MEFNAESSEPIDRKRYFQMGEVTEILGVKAHKIRYWDDQFKLLDPDSTPGGNRQFDRRDLRILRAIQYLLEREKYTVEGAREKLESLFTDQPQSDPMDRINGECDRALNDIREFMENI